MESGQKRAVGVIRVSKVGSRDGEGFASPDTQAARINASCETNGLRLVRDPFEELNVSGGAELDQRPGLGPAVAMIERGEADVLIAAYFDRFFRNTEVQQQVIKRVEAAGGEVFAVDMGRVSRETSGLFLTSAMAGTVSEYLRLVSGEKSSEAVARAIARGVPPWPRITPGYVRGEDQRFHVDPDRAPVVLAAFERRVQGDTIRSIQAFMRANGFPAMGFRGVQNMIATRSVRGEIHFGSFTPNLEAHTPIVPEDMWKRAQAVKLPRGRRGKSERLLAKTQILRCANCGASLVVSGSNHGKYFTYRCPPTGACVDRVAISATIAEDAVVAYVRKRLADEEGRASADANIREAEVAAERAREQMQNAVATLTGFEDVAGARERLTALRDAVETAEANLERLGGSHAHEIINANVDWDRLGLGERRDLIRATIKRAVVTKGRGPDRITIEPLGE